MAAWMQGAVIGLLAGVHVDTPLFVAVLAVYLAGYYCFRCRGAGVLLVTALLAYGYAVHAMQGRAEARLPSQWAGHLFHLHGYACSSLERLDGGWRFDLCLTDLPELAQPSASPALPAINPALPAINKVRLRYYADTLPGVFDASLRVTARLKPPRGWVNPAGFDYEAYLMTEGIDATGTVVDWAQVPQGSNGLAARYHRWRGRLLADFTREAAHFEQAPSLLALAFGDNSGIDHGQWALLRDTGTVHLLVVSGLHIGMVFGLGWWLGRAWLLCLNRPAGRHSAAQRALWVGLALAMAYTALAGFSMPTQRALLVCTVFCITAWQRGFNAPLRALGLAFVLVLLINPMQSTQAGFWLSFGACIVIWLAVAGQGAVPRQGFGRWLKPLKLQGVLLLALLPLSVGLNHHLPLQSWVANLLAVPWVTFLVVPWVLLGAWLSALQPEWGLAPLTLADWGLQCLWWVLHQVNTLMPWKLAVPHIDLAATVVLCGLLCLAVVSAPGRWLALFCLLVIEMPREPALHSGEMQVDVLDVGQGLAVLVRTRNHALLYDTGQQYSPAFGGATAAVLPTLRHYGVTRLDRLVLSHGDADHASGAAALLAALPVDSVWAGEPLATLPQPAWPCVGQQRWQWDSVRFEVVHPRRGPTAAGNNASCVLRIDSHQHSLLLTGDIERSVEIDLAPHLSPVDMLLVPHHGSLTSSSYPFIKAVKPRWAVVSAGYLNRFGHPHGKIRQRYRALGAHWFSTAQAGAVTMRFFADGTQEILTWRQRRDRPWRGH